MIPVTPLESWISRSIGCSGSTLKREDLERYQVKRLNETISRVKRQSRFYREHLKHVNGAIKSLSDITFLPFTTFADLSEDPVAFSCVPQTEISRVMTVSTSGTTGAQKRVFYTEEDQESTTDFFHYGMANLTDAGDRVLILLPGELPGSIGDLLHAALGRMGAIGFKYGFVDDAERVMSVINANGINVMVGIPVQVLSLVRNCRTRPEKRMKSVLLTTDYVPQAISRTVEAAWGCNVFNHYGATEMGLGGGVQCRAFGGYHLREADMLFEIVDPDTGGPVPDDEYGEVVFTSLTARGTPFVRYRTGDISRFLSEPCLCGTVLKAMEPVRGRIKGNVRLSGDCVLELRELDEALFALDGVLDFEASLTGTEADQTLSVGISLSPGADGQSVYRIEQAVRSVPSIRAALDMGNTAVKVRVLERVPRRGAAKRIITDKRAGTPGF